jgi:TPR repeat protein
MYDKAWGPARDLRTAKRYYRNAANDGDARAMVRLGALYGEDLKSASDPQAQTWYRDEMLSMYHQAAQLNDSEAKAWIAKHDAR